MLNLYKYPHTPYLPWSPSVDSDDPVIDADECFKGKEVVITEKMDGENTTMYPYHIHARSLFDDGHVSKDWIKNFWAQRRHLIPDRTRICGENLYITHSIKYEDLETYFLAFSVWRDSLCLSWNNTLTVLKFCGIMPVPTIWRGIYDEGIKHMVVRSNSEGYVIRLADAFKWDDFSTSVGKWVRPNHVQIDAKHWKHTTLYKNNLKE